MDAPVPNVQCLPRGLRYWALGYGAMASSPAITCVLASCCQQSKLSRGCYSANPVVLTECVPQSIRIGQAAIRKQKRVSDRATSSQCPRPSCEEVEGAEHDTHRINKGGVKPSTRLYLYFVSLTAPLFVASQLSISKSTISRGIPGHPMNMSSPSGV